MAGHKLVGIHDPRFRRAAMGQTWGWAIRYKSNQTIAPGERANVCICRTVSLTQLCVTADFDFLSVLVSTLAVSAKW